MSYTIRRVDRLDPAAAHWDTPQWRRADTLAVTHFPWEDSGHHPYTQARLLYDAESVAVHFCVEDRYVRAVAEKFQDGVCTDSCVEFFVSPRPDSQAYFNFEVNCGGTMLLHRCPAPAERDAGRGTEDVSDADGETIEIAHSQPKRVEREITEPTTWTVEYRVPFDLFTKYLDAPAPQAGTVWKANFYKCGDRTSHPHWGSWYPVDTPRPNFHQPDFFQPIVFA